MTTSEPLHTPPTPPSTDALQLTRERDRQPVIEFLRRHHPLGGIQGWKACFGARYRDSLVAVVVLGRPTARHNDDGDTVAITRWARRDDRPANTGSWLIARAREWARLEGYRRVLTHAGVNDNTGTTYRAAGFDLLRTTRADGSGWSTRENRTEWSDYDRRTYEYTFDNPL